MRIKRAVQIAVDAFMTVLLLVMFVVPWTGIMCHEWLGAVLFGLIIIHNALNFRWYTSLVRGPYNARRVGWTAVNLGLLAAMSAAACSGVMVSQHVFSFLQLDGSLLWRKVHLTSAYWGLILTGMHIGLHGLAIAGVFKKYCPAPLLKGGALLLAVYGMYVCWQTVLWQKLFFLETFSAPAPSAAASVVRHLSLVGLFAVLIYHLFVKKSAPE